MKTNIKKQLKSLQQIKPNCEWTKSHRDILMSQIQAQVCKQKKPLYKLFGAVSFDILKSSKIIFKHSFVGLTMFCIVFGGSIWSVKASEESLPGDLFYSIKLTKEKVQVKMTGSDDKKTELHIEFAGKRIEEIGKVKELTSNDDKNKKIKTAIDVFKDEINKAKEQLNEVEKTVKEPKKIVKVAKLVDEKVEEYKDVLSKGIKKDIKNENSIEVQESVNEAIKASKEVVDQAVNVMIKQKDKGDEEVNEDVKNSVLEKIDKISKDADELEGVINGREEEDKDAAENDELNEEKTEEDNQEENTLEEGQTQNNEEEPSDNAKEETNEDVTAEVVKDTETEEEISNELINEDSTENNSKDSTNKKPEDVKVILQEANAYVEQGDLDKAVEKIKESSDMVDEIEEKLDEEPKDSPEQKQDEVNTEDANNSDIENNKNTDNEEENIQTDNNEIKSE